MLKELYTGEGCVSGGRGREGRGGSLIPKEALLATRCKVEDWQGEKYHPSRAWYSLQVSGREWMGSHPKMDALLR